MAAVTLGREARPGNRAVAKYVRSSAFKAREVLDLVRGKSYTEAREILQFSERRISNTIAKCLDSAVANAEHNDELDGDELFVAACYADEGPTLKRWRPRARGRATRIRKRTCHITVVVARYTDDELTAIEARLALKGTGRRSSAAEARRRRVAASRERDAVPTEEPAEETENQEPTPSSDGEETSEQAGATEAENDEADDQDSRDGHEADEIADRHGSDSHEEELEKEEKEKEA